MTQPAAGASAAFLGATAAYVPARVVPNAELAGALGVDAEWILATSGIEARRYAAADESVVDLAVAAACRCLTGIDLASIGMLIVSSGTPDRRWPGPAAAVARTLGLGDIPALDLAMPSAGGVFALALASQLATHDRDVLVVAAERMSSVVAQPGTHPNVAVLFGDGAAACVVSRRGGRARFVGHVLHTDGTFEDALHLGVHTPLEMDGRTIIMQAARKLPQVVTEVLAQHAMPIDRVRTFLLHQANQNLLKQVARGLKVEETRVFSNIRHYGNTSSASVLIALSEWGDREGFVADVPVVMAAFGAGLNWGALLLDGV